MNSVERYLDGVRRQQLGEHVPELEDLRRKAMQQPRSRPVRVRRSASRDTNLHFVPSARRGMHRLGWEAADVYAVFLNGEPTPGIRNRTNYTVTDEAIEAASERMRPRLAKLRGCSIVVAPPRYEGESRALITVLPSHQRPRS